jgi:hypothetical protein
MTQHAPKTTDEYQQRRAWWLMLLTAAFAIFQTTTALRALQVSLELIGQMWLPPALDFMAGGGWALLAGIITLRLWQRRTGARRLAAWLLAGFSIYSFSRLFLFSQADYDRGRFPFLLACTLTLVILVAARTLRPSQTATTEIIQHGSKPEN